MSKNFNLLLLHQPEDIHPRTWICLKGSHLNAILKSVEKEILADRDWNREKLGKVVSDRLGCAHNTITYSLQGEREFYPIAIISELLKLSKNKKRFLSRIRRNIAYLKVNSASAKPVKAVFRTNKNIAKILGAFMADGSLSIQIVFTASNLQDLSAIDHILKKNKIQHSSGDTPSRNQHYISAQANERNIQPINKIIHSFRPLVQIHYGIELTDEYKDSVEAFAGWIKEEFHILPNRFGKKKNAWRVTFSSKILSRYLTTFFEVKPGPKAHTALEPSIVKKLDIEHRKAFAKGVLMFDGHVTYNKKIILSVKSELLTNSIADIWKEDKIKFGRLKNKRGDWCAYTISGNKTKKLLEYFEKDTQKWKLLNWLEGSIQNMPKISVTRNSTLSLEKVLDIVNQVKCCDANFLKNYFKCSHYTIRTYLKVLRDQNKIKLSCQPKTITESVDMKTNLFLETNFHRALFSKIRYKFKTDKDFADFLIINNATLSAWRVGRNRIPVYVIKRMCEILEINFYQLIANIRETDREIAETIQ